MQWKQGIQDPYKQTSSSSLSSARMQHILSNIILFYFNKQLHQKRLTAADPCIIHYIKSFILLALQKSKKDCLVIEISKLRSMVPIRILQPLFMKE